MHDCKKKSLVKEVRIDKNKIESLIKLANQKITASDLLPNELGESKISLLYDSLRMILEHIALNKGFKIYNHECYTAFLKEILNDSTLGNQFDNFRKIRNAINYYGKEINQEECLELIKQMKKFISKLDKIEIKK